MIIEQEQRSGMKCIDKKISRGIEDLKEISYIKV